MNGTVEALERPKLLPVSSIITGLVIVCAAAFPSVTTSAVHRFGSGGVAADFIIRNVAVRGGWLIAVGALMCTLLPWWLTRSALA
jgi:hypothetical protein